MRITAEHARIMSRYAGRLSNGYVAEVETGQDLGRGARIMDMNSQVKWHGRPREAVAYYLGQVEEFAAARGIGLADLPGEVTRIGREVMIDGQMTDGIREWYGTGRKDGRSRVESYCPEIRGAGRI